MRPDEQIPQRRSGSLDRTPRPRAVHKMQFLPGLRTHLKEHGIIYTVRKYRYQPDPDTILVDDVGECFRQCIRPIDGPADLAPYVNRSGFGDIPAWWMMITRLIPPGGPYYLYRVTKL